MTEYVSAYVPLPVASGGALLQRASASVTVVPDSWNDAVNTFSVIVPTATAQ